MQTTAASETFEAIDFRTLTAAVVSRRFMRLSVLCALAGMAMGVYMGISEDWALRPAHVHVNLLGWVSCAIYALVYRATPRMADDRLVGRHFVLATSALIATLIAMPLHLYGHAWIAPLVSAAFLGHVAGMAVFAVLVFKHF